MVKPVVKYFSTNDPNDLVYLLHYITNKEEKQKHFIQRFLLQISDLAVSGVHKLWSNKCFFTKCCAQKALFSDKISKCPDIKLIY